MFEKSVYVSRRQKLLALMQEKSAKGIAIFLGHVEAPMNYKGNDYRFRQDSTFLYFWGIDEPGFAAVLDLESGSEVVYANDFTLDDIVWMGPQPSVASKAERVGVAKSAPAAGFSEAVKAAIAQGRPVHYLPPPRYYNTLTISNLTGTHSDLVSTVAPMDKDGGKHASEELLKTIVSMRLIKEQCEIEAMDYACELGYDMHVAARRAIRLGILEQEVVGAMEGQAIATGWGPSFPTILSQNGETLHNHTHHQVITAGRLLVVDAGAESNDHYASDFTRTYPTAGKFTEKQREIYDIVAACNEHALSLTRPGITYREVHLASVRLMLENLKSLGFVNGDVDEMLAIGVGGMFQPHGLGHNMGLDVHDMEDYGEDYVGYDPDQTRAPQLGLGNLRMARKLVPGYVMSNEPGLYFIPALIEQFKKDGTFGDLVNWSKLEGYYDFGGCRIEDDVLVTEAGSRLLGSRRLPVWSKDVEAAMEEDKK